MLASLLSCANETSLHGVARLTSNRTALVKTFWLVAFLSSFGYCIVRIFDACDRYASGDIATTIKDNGLDFEFPDVYLCNEKPISGSLSVSLSSEDASLLNQYRGMVRAVVSEFGLENSQTALDTYAIRLVNSLPFRFLSDKMGHRLSSVLYVYVAGKKEWRLFILNSPKSINCFGLNLTNSERSALQNPSNAVQLVLFLDAYFPPWLDKAVEQDIRDLNGRFFNFKPVDWDAAYGTDYTVSNGFRVFLTPKGKHPSELDTQILVGSAQKHSIDIEMQDRVYADADFLDHCVSKSRESTAQFVNPYTGSTVTLEYSQAVCWYREVARISSENFNCSVYPIMTPWEYRALPSCFNLSRTKTDYIIDIDMVSMISSTLDKARENCEREAPCRNRMYSYKHSASDWPSSRVWQEFLRPTLVDSDDGFESPGLSHLFYNSTFEEVKQSILQVELVANSRRSQEVQLSLAYSFNSLIADMGGLLGLFMGMSLLSILELLELMHNFATVAFDAIRQRLARGTDVAATKKSGSDLTVHVEDEGDQNYSNSTTEGVRGSSA